MTSERLRTLLSVKMSTMNRRMGRSAEQLHTAGTAGVGPEAQRDGADEQEDDADGEEGRQCVYQSGGAGVAEAEVDACDA